MRTVLIVALIFLSKFAFPQESESFRFTHLTIENGLPDNNVSTMHMDKIGFAWIGTNRGLSRYDGHTFKNFTHSSSDSTTISGNIIKSITEDSDRNLWIGTIGGALNKFDPITEKFKSYKYKIENPYFEGQDVTTLLLDQKENIWLGTFSCGLQYFDKTTEKFTRYNIDENFETRIEAFNKNTVHSIIEDISDPNIIWVGSSKGLYIFNKKTQNLESVPIVENGKKNTDTAILDLYMVKPGEIWLGTWRLGLVKYTLKDNSWQLKIPDKKEYLKNNYFSNIINRVEKKSNDELWVCSQDQGLMIYNTIKNKFTRIKNNLADPNSILTNQINGIFKDNQNRHWVFNAQKGISLIDPVNQYFRFHDLNPEGKCPENVSQVYSFGLDVKSGNLYISTIGCERFYVFDKNKNLLQSLPINPEFITSENGYSVLVSSDQTVYLAGGTVNPETASLFIFNKQTNSLESFTHPDLDKVPIHSYKISGITEDKNNNIWLSTFFGGLIKIDRNSNQIKQYLNQTPTPNSIDIRTEINKLKLSSDGKIWLATLQEGVFSFDPLSEKFTHYSSFNDPQKGLRGNRIIVLEEDSQNNIWVGLSSTGIQVIDPNKEDWLIGSFQSSDGLPNEQIWNMSKDNRGKIWLSTQYGLCRFDEKNKSFIQYTKPDGLKDPALFKKGMYHAPNGEMYIGQTEGFYTFFPEEIYNKQSKPNLALTSFQVFDKDFPLENDINSMDKIDLNYNENFFTIGFAALNFTGSKKNKYKFKLEGYDDDWIYHQGNRNFANYTKVPPGKYTFYLQGANSENIWSDEIQSLNINIQPPIWKTWWAYIIYLVLGISILRGLYIFQIKKRLAEQEAKHFKDLNNEKTKLFSNITHELRTPLTVVIGSVDRAKRLNRNLTDKELSLVKDNGEHLLQLINQVLDIEKIDAGAMPLEYEWKDIIEYLEYITYSFETLADEKNIALNFEAFPNNCQAYFDKEKLAIVLSNLLSNAVKFTSEEGIISVFIKIQELTSNQNRKSSEGLEDQKLLVLNVKDNGVGIDKKQLPYIFNRFYQAKPNNKKEKDLISDTKGTGIGLSLAKDLMALMGGKITANSIINKGSTFQIEMPIRIKRKPTSKSIVTNDQNLPIILVVEDNASLIKYISSGLSPYFKVMVESNGKNGLDRAFEIIPDLIISDVIMPVKDGITLCKELKNDKRTSHIPVILLTAKTGQTSKVIGLQSGADAYLTKPFDEQELLVRINNLIHQRSNLRSYYLQKSGISNSNDQLVSSKNEAEHKKESEFIEKVKTIMEHHIENPDFNMALLCKTIGLSNTQLHRKLVALTGQPPIKLIRAIKINKAKDLLISTSKPISEIAFQTGFSDPAYFSKTFKSETGYSPKNYRQNMR